MFHSFCSFFLFCSIFSVLLHLHFLHISFRYLYQYEGRQLIELRIFSHCLPSSMLSERCQRTKLKPFFRILQIGYCIYYKVMEKRILNEFIIWFSGNFSFSSFKTISNQHWLMSPSTSSMFHPPNLLVYFSPSHGSSFFFFFSVCTRDGGNRNINSAF